MSLEFSVPISNLCSTYKNQVHSNGALGLGFLNTFQDILQDSKAPVIKNDAGVPNRGAKTRLTRREINNKLAQVPVFYLEKGGRVFVENNTGYFFTEKVQYAQ